MFYANSSIKLKFFMISLGRFYLAGNNTFIYLEDKDDLSTISGKPLQPGIEKRIEDSELILAAIGPNATYYISSFIQILRSIANFRVTPKIFNSVRSGYNFTQWNNNVILLQETAGPSATMLLPYRTSASELFFQDHGYSYSPFFFLQTFQTRFWIYLLVVALFTMGCLAISSKLSRGRKDSASSDIFNFIALCLDNSSEFVTSIISYRIILLSFLVLLVIFYAAFNAQLDALLAIKKINLPFASLNELLMRTDYTLCISKFSKAENYVRRLRNEINGRLAIGSKYCPETNRIRLGWLKDFNFRCNTTNMSFFFSTGSGTFEKYLIKECNLMKFPGTFFKLQPTFIVSLDFPFREFLNRKIITTWTSGHVDYITNVAYHKIILSAFQEPPENNQMQIEFDHCKLMILLWCVGFVYAFIVLGLEMLAKKLHHNNDVTPLC